MPGALFIRSRGSIVITLFEYSTISLFRLTEASGRIGHAELDFDGATLMLSDEFPEFGIKGPETIGATSMAIHIHVDEDLSPEEMKRRYGRVAAT